MAHVLHRNKQKSNLKTRYRVEETEYVYWVWVFFMYIALCDLMLPLFPQYIHLLFAALF